MYFLLIFSSNIFFSEAYFIEEYSRTYTKYVLTDDVISKAQ